MGARVSGCSLCEVGTSNGLMSVFLGSVVREIVLSSRDGTSCESAPGGIDGCRDEGGGAWDLLALSLGALISCWSLFVVV